MPRIFNKKIVWECHTCNGSAWQRDEKGVVAFENGLGGRCQTCYLPQKFLDANIGFDYWAISPENWEGSKNDLKNIQKLFPDISKLYQEGRGIFLQGSYGVGKTSLACMFLKEVLKTTNYSALFVPFSELVLTNSKIMTGWHDHEIEEIISQIKNVDFLVLDDLAKEYDNERDNGRATLNTILRYRDMWNKPTIYTANISINETQEKYGASNFSIIRGRSKVITMENSNDFRSERRIRQELST